MSKARQHDNSARQWESIAYAGAPLCVNNGVAVLRNIRIYPYSEILLTVPTEGSEKYKARGESNTYINGGCSDCSAIIPIDGPAKKVLDNWNWILLSVYWHLWSQPPKCFPGHSVFSELQLQSSCTCNVYGIFKPWKCKSTYMHIEITEFSTEINCFWVKWEAAA